MVGLGKHASIITTAKGLKNSHFRSSLLDQGQVKNAINDLSFTKTKSDQALTKVSFSAYESVHNNCSLNVSEGEMTRA